MFWIGLLCGVALIMPFALFRRRMQRGGLACVAKSRSINTQQETHWSQTRNFLYYDGTEMPLNKEEPHE